MVGLLIAATVAMVASLVGTRFLIVWLLNRKVGQPIHEDVKGRGPALTDADMDAIVAKLRTLHANVTRAHYLLNARLLDRLDRAGIMVWSQAPIYHRDRLLETPAQRAVALSTVRGTVLGARIHPSVITDSVARMFASGVWS